MSVAIQRAMTHARTKVMLVDDSAVVRGMVRKWLEADGGIEVVAAAVNGQVAIETVVAAAPDIIILDIEMPVMDGITALPTLLRLMPSGKVLMASTLTSRNAQITLRALGLGATDYLAKPSFVKDGNTARDEFQQELIAKVQTLAGATPAAATPSPTSAAHAWTPMPAATDTFTLRKISKFSPRILAIGSSTGGPQALTTVFESLKGKLDKIPVVVAQHMPPTFTRLLAEKLVRCADMKGGEAEHGQELLPGHLYLAPGGHHMRLERIGTVTKIALDDGPAINHCRPAVDPMFESVAKIFGNSTLGVVLTGMGSDGARGALQMADAGGSVLVQDEPTSVVWGMPGATAQIGAAAQVLPLEKIASKIQDLTMPRSFR